MAVESAKSRSRLIGQLFGQVTWQRTRAEIAIASATRATATGRGKGGKKGAAGKGGPNRRRRRGGKRTKKKGGKSRRRRDTTEVTLNQLAKMDEEDSEPEEKPVRLSKKADTAVEDPDDWGPGSSNQNVRVLTCACVCLRVCAGCGQGW